MVLFQQRPQTFDLGSQSCRVAFLFLGPLFLFLRALLLLSCPPALDADPFLGPFRLFLAGQNRLARLQVNDVKARIRHVGHE